MEKLNKYWYVHGGFSFFYLDTKTHEIAIKQIGEAMTSHASVYYHKPLLLDSMSNAEYKINIIAKTNSSITIQWQIIKNGDLFVTWIFTFVKIKNNNN